ncbi:MAG: deoxyribonuclease IV [bacterium]
MSSNDDLMLGFHASISGGLGNVPDRIKTLDCPTGQIFTSNNRQWAIRDLREGEAEAFKTGCGELSGGVTAHACYLINLAKSDQDPWEKSVRTLVKELDRAEELDIPYLVLHPGSHVGNGEEDGIKRIGEALNKTLEDSSSQEASILLETMAGQGTGLGYRLEQLVAMEELVDHDDRIHYCVDTCHMHAGGYDLSTEAGYEDSMQRVEDVLGLDNVKVLHLNDSEADHDSRVDRHENIGEGTIGEEGFRALMNDDRWTGVPKILETPVDDDWEEDYGHNLKTLRSYVD